MIPAKKVMEIEWRDDPANPENMTTRQLVELLRAGNHWGRSEAATLLLKCGATSKWKELCRALKDPWWAVRCTAAEALGHFKVRAAIPHLRRALRTRNTIVKGWVATALADLGDIRSKLAFEQMWRSKSPRLQLSGAVSLYVMGDRPRLADVAEFLVNWDYRLKCAATNELVWMVIAEDVPEACRHFRSAIRTEKTPAYRSMFGKAIRFLTRWARTQK